jgi:hypothetical protein
VCHNWGHASPTVVSAWNATSTFNSNTSPHALLTAVTSINNVQEQPLCSVCMGMWYSNGNQGLEKRIAETCQSCCGISHHNPFPWLPKHVPTVVFIRDILFIGTNGLSQGGYSVYLQDLKHQMLVAQTEFRKA